MILKSDFLKFHRAVCIYLNLTSFCFPPAFFQAVKWPQCQPDLFENLILTQASSDLSLYLSGHFTSLSHDKPAVRVSCQTVPSLRQCDVEKDEKDLRSGHEMDQK